MSSAAFAGRRILLGVTGGIASYKTVWLARLLQQAGAEVDVVMTRAAAEFVGPITFEAVTGRRVHTELLAEGHALDHIRLAREASAIVVAPATADFMARAATGQADDLLTACLLAAGPAGPSAPPVLLVPAMNDRMWAHGQTRRNADHLRALGYAILAPDDGPLAVGEGSGPGRMPEPETILAHLQRLLATGSDQSLAGTRIVVTAGPTREPVDPVRFISNRSSGRMGIALAAAASRRGASVLLIHGPVTVPLPLGIEARSVESTAQMAAAVRDALASADVLIMAAAPADFRPAVPATDKIKKRQAQEPIALAPTDDILQVTREARRPGATIVGFALETRDAVANGWEKLRAKGLDLVVVNDATEAGAGFEVESNRVTILREGREPDVLALMSKNAVADVILDRVVELRNGR